MTNDFSRTATKTFYVHLASNMDSPFNQQGVTNCSIYEYTNSGSYLKFNNITIFEFKCPSNTTLTNSIISGSTLDWSVDELVKSDDYFIVSNKVYLKPYLA
jgi:hypothetical protein